MKRSKLFISCEEAHAICDKTQYNDASFWDKLKLTLRLSWCKVTRAYTKKNNALTDAIKTSNIECLKQCEKEEMNTKLESQLSNQKKE